MPDVTEQLRRYGEALEESLTGAGEGHPAGGTSHGRHRILQVAAALTVLAATAGIVATIGTRDASRDRVSSKSGGTGEGVFSTNTGATLLLRGGPGVLVSMDLDRRTITRAGLPAGARSASLLAFVGGHVIVRGQGDEILSVDTVDGAVTDLGVATMILPAAESDELWAFTGLGEATASAGPMVRRVSVDGQVTQAPEPFTPSDAVPLVGVPGGVAIRSADGLHLWDGATASSGPPLSTTPAVTVAASNGRQIAWCDQTCASVHTAPLPTTGAATPHILRSSGPALALSDERMAVLEPSSLGSALVVTDLTSGRSTTVAHDLFEGALQWSPDGDDLYYSDTATQEATVRLGRFHAPDGRWTTATVPTSARLGLLVVARNALEGPLTDTGEPSRTCAAEATRIDTGPPCALQFTVTELETAERRRQQVDDLLRAERDLGTITATRGSD